MAGVVALLLVVSTEGATSAPRAAAIAKLNERTTRHHDARKPRVLLLGDSQAVSLTYYGSDAFNSSGSTYLFKPILGCGVFDNRRAHRRQLRPAPQPLADPIRAFNPDLSVLLIGAWETLDFTVGGQTFVHGHGCTRKRGSSGSSPARFTR